MSNFKDEIVGGDGKRYYRAINEDGSILSEKVRFEKNYPVTQEGNKFGAVNANDVLYKGKGGVVSKATNFTGALQKSGYDVITTAGGTITGAANFTGELKQNSKDVATIETSLAKPTVKIGTVVLPSSNITCNLTKIGNIVQGYLEFNFKSTGYISVSNLAWQNDSSNGICQVVRIGAPGGGQVFHANPGFLAIKGNSTYSSVWLDGSGKPHDGWAFNAPGGGFMEFWLSYTV